MCIGNILIESNKSRFGMYKSLFIAKFVRYYELTIFV